MSKTVNKRSNKMKFYDTALWKRVRIQTLQQYPLCYMCKKEGKIEPATIVDHIIGFEDKHDPLANDPENFVTLCKSHHQSVTVRFDQSGKLEGLSIEEALKIKYESFLFDQDGYLIEAIE